MILHGYVFFHYLKNAIKNKQLIRLFDDNKYMTEIKKLIWNYDEDRSLNAYQKSILKNNVDNDRNGELGSEEIKAAFEKLKLKTLKCNHYAAHFSFALSLIMKHFKDNIPHDFYLLKREASKFCLRDLIKPSICSPIYEEKAKNVPFKECKFPTGFPWPELTKNDLYSNPNLIRRIKKAILFIERGRYGKIDTYGIKETCNTFHVHLLRDTDDFQRYEREYLKAHPEYNSLPKSEIVKYSLDLISKDDKKTKLLYHTEEWTERFKDYSWNRTIVQHTPNGKPERSGGIKCVGKVTMLSTFDFALVEKKHPLYKYGNRLPDGRRFIVWLSK